MSSSCQERGDRYGKGGGYRLLQKGERDGVDLTKATFGEKDSTPAAKVIYEEEKRVGSCKETARGGGPKKLGLLLVRR